MPEEAANPRLNRWPFWLGDIVLLGLAAAIVWRGSDPFGVWPALVLFLCVATGGWLAVLPFLIEFRARLKLTEAERLAGAIAELQKVDQVRDHIARASDEWASIQERAEKTNEHAQKIAERMTAETKEFFQFLEKADATEKKNLRLEAEKLRRAEGDWIQMVMLIFDHIFGLYQAALRSGQERVERQVTQFQFACRDIVRRVGLIPFFPEQGEPFDPRRHQLEQADQQPAPGASIATALNPGFTYQGQVLRRALVTLNDEAAPAPAAGGGEVSREEVAGQVPKESLPPDQPQPAGADPARSSAAEDAEQPRRETSSDQEELSL